MHKYLVHLKTQQAYARNEGGIDIVYKIQKWFDRFTEALCILLDDNTVTLKYDYKEYDSQIHVQGREPFGFDTLSDGYSSVILIVSDLMLRMEQDWLSGNNISTYDKEGIVLIDEIETHLHISLQKKILPFLIKFFPRIQFIVTTHSPYILNSVSNAKAYDLEKHMELENLAVYSSDGLADGYLLKGSGTEYSYVASLVGNYYVEIPMLNKTDMEKVLKHMGAVLDSGRLPEKAGEVVLDSMLIKNYGYKLGNGLSQNNPMICVLTDGTVRDLKDGEIKLQDEITSASSQDRNI